MFVVATLKFEVAPTWRVVGKDVMSEEDCGLGMLGEGKGKDKKGRTVCGRRTIQCLPYSAQLRTIADHSGSTARDNTKRLEVKLVVGIECWRGGGGVR